MRRDALTAVLAVAILTVMLGIVYPLVVTGVSQLAFPGKANGSKVTVHGRLAGSRLLAQAYGQLGKDRSGNPTYVPDPHYFQPRPSATSPFYNAAATAFSNNGPNSRATLAAFQANIRSYLSLEGPYDRGLTVAKLPVDAVTTSGSGVDPSISEANAAIQANRIAAVRHLSPPRMRSLIAASTHGRSLGFLGEPAVNVVELNLALDRVSRGAG